MGENSLLYIRTWQRNLCCQAWRQAPFRKFSRRYFARTRWVSVAKDFVLHVQRKGNPSSKQNAYSAIKFRNSSILWNVATTRVVQWLEIHSLQLLHNRNGFFALSLRFIPVSRPRFVLGKCQGILSWFLYVSDRSCGLWQMCQCRETTKGNHRHHEYSQEPFLPTSERGWNQNSKWLRTQCQVTGDI